MSEPGAPYARTVAVVLAAGSGTRLGAGRNKVLLELAGRPLLAWSLAAFEASQRVDDIVLVVRATDRCEISLGRATDGCAKLRAVVDGGATRHHSEEAALEVIAADILDGRVELVLVHDAARPFVGPALLDRVIDAARAHGGAIPGLPLPAAVLGMGEDGWARRLPSDDLRRVQTPQAFRARELLAAFRATRSSSGGRLTAGVDTAETVARATELEIRVVDGDERNVKITFADDLRTAAALAATARGRPVTGPSP
jgi:2-C-methyl-D-erythritol 4-phosphate cytidylyltransferase